MRVPLERNTELDLRLTRCSSKRFLMRRFKAPLSWLCSLLLLLSVSQSGSLFAQSAVRIEPAKGGLGWLTRPYQQRYVPPINLTNSNRLESLVRAGNLYLSAQ